jgi:hypothetical protein
MRLADEETTILVCKLLEAYDICRREFASALAIQQGL